MKKIVNRLFKALMTFLKDRLVKQALKSILGSAAAGGIKGFIIKYIATELFEEVGEPLFKFLKRNGFLVIDKIEGEIKIRKIDRAEVDKNEEAYINSISSI